MLKRRNLIKAQSTPQAWQFGLCRVVPDKSCCALVYCWQCCQVAGCETTQQLGLPVQQSPCAGSSLGCYQEAQHRKQHYSKDPITAKYNTMQQNSTQCNTPTMHSRTHISPVAAHITLLHTSISRHVCFSTPTASHHMGSSQGLEHACICQEEWHTQCAC